MSAQVSSQFAENVRSENQRQDQLQQRRQQAVMTPGVSEGISSGRMHSVADSPVMRSSSRSFKIGDKDYNYDPYAAEQDTALSKAAAEEEANKVRYESLKKIPGIGDRGAARQVYGRAYDEQDKTEKAAAMAEYVRNPSREAAAKVIEIGGELPFPSDLFTKPHENELQHRDQGPAYGTPEYMDYWNKMQDVSEARQNRQIEARGEQARLTQSQRKPGMRRFLDSRTGQEYWVDPQNPTERVYTDVTGQGSFVDRMVREQMGGDPPVAPGRYRDNAPPLKPGTTPSPAYRQTYGMPDQPTGQRSSGQSVLPVPPEVQLILDNPNIPPERKARLKAALAIDGIIVP